MTDSKIKLDQATLEASDDAMKVQAQTKLDGNCLGPPAIANGRVYVHSTEALYCFAGEGAP